MLYVGLYIVVTCMYLWVFRVLVMPPHTWITQTVLCLNWISAVFICITTILLVNKCRKPINRDLLCEIHGNLPEYRVFCLGFSMLSVVLILLEAGHIKTASISCLSLLCTCVFVWRVLINPPQTVRCEEDSQRLIYKAHKAWDRGDFHRVAVILEQLSIREIEDFTELIEQTYGMAEARMISKLLN